MTDTCRDCGVHHGDPCPECGGRGFHTSDPYPCCGECSEGPHADGCPGVTCPACEGWEACCETCGGSGRIPPGWCPACHGGADLGTLDCLDCGGTGGAGRVQP